MATLQEAVQNLSTSLATLAAGQSAITDKVSALHNQLISATGVDQATVDQIQATVDQIQAAADAVNTAGVALTNLASA